MDSVKYIGMDVHKGAITIAILILWQPGDGVHDRNQGSRHPRVSERIAREPARDFRRRYEEYYRSKFRERISSRNLRDTHMAETLDALVEHLGAKEAKIVVWAHNSHLGDARATEQGQQGELNRGQLIREKYGKEAVLVSFTPYTGTMTAASEWNGPAERKHVRPALPESYESLFHNTGIDNFLLLFDDDRETASLLRKPRLERAIGVIYLPQSERVSHYFPAQLLDQFDAVLHFDETRAVEPLERTGGWLQGEVSETYPSMLELSSVSGFPSLHPFSARLQ